MARLTKTLATIDIYGTGTTTQPGPYQVGQIAWDVNGKAFRYVLAGASALVRGNLLQSPVSLGSTYQNMVVGTAGAVGDAYIQVTNGTSTITSQQFEGGSISVYTAGTAAIGEEYTIVGVTGTLTSGGALKVYTDRPLRTAITTSATVNMMPSPFAGVIVCPTTLTGIPVGVAVAPIAANAYGWIQTHGVAPYIADGSAVVVGAMLGAAQSVAGSMTLATAGAGYAVVGKALATGASGKGATMFLNID
jgi:hypothetical protein